MDLVTVEHTVDALGRLQTKSIDVLLIYEVAPYVPGDRTSPPERARADLQQITLVGFDTGGIYIGGQFIHVVMPTWFDWLMGYLWDRLECDEELMAEALVAREAKEEESLMVAMEAKMDRLLGRV